MGEGIDLRTQERNDRPARPVKYQFVVTTDVNPSRVYAARESAGRVFRSDDRGETWRNTLFQHRGSPEFNVGPDYLIDEKGGGGDNISGFAINPANPDHLVVGDWMNCFITRDGGKTWAAAHTRSAEEPAGAAKGMRWVEHGARRHDGLELLPRPVRARSALHRLHRHRLRPVDRRGQDLVLADRQAAPQHHL